jgi:hypothetical protein
LTLEETINSFHGLQHRETNSWSILKQTFAYEITYKILKSFSINVNKCNT